MADQAGTRILDFTNVKDRSQFNPKRKTPGDYAAKIVAVEETKSQGDTPKDMWVFHIRLKNDATGLYPYRCTLDEKSLWKIRNLFIAAGMAVPKKKVRVNPTRVVGKEVGITLDDHEYNDRISSQVQAVFPLDELGDSEPEQTADVKEDMTAEGTEVDDEELEEIDIDEV